MQSVGLKRPILQGRVDFPVCLAPMVGLSNVALRLLVRRYLPAGAQTIWPTEMLNSRRLPEQKLGFTPETYRDGDERGLVPQILGNEPEPIINSVRLLREWGAEGVDINMGCPVNKALRHNYGVALMGDAGYAAEVVKMAAEASDLPVSVKLRAGLQNDREFLLKFVLGLQAAGAKWLTLHPRVAEQKRRGQADWEQIRFVRERVDVPVIGNGDVQTAEDVFRMLDETGCDMVMVGRVLTARPWLLWQVGEKLGWSAPPGFEGMRAPVGAEEEGAEFLRGQLFLLGIFRRFFKEDLGVRRFLFQLKNAMPWLDYGHSLWSGGTACSSYDQLEQLLRATQVSGLRMTQRTELRQ